ncbi:band 4.1-like protein 4 isoform X3 [Babylonia areolata]|uniref:band 4.1-like protein 4 isoform X3 n=1 Tax=Babylonia areolata TaxID=304850 RepID=UPI003FD5E5E7
MSKTGKSRLSRLLPKFLRGGDKKAEGSIDSKSPFCIIHFLDDSDHQMQIKSNWKGSALQDRVCELLNLHEKDYFGLRFIDSTGQTHWLDRSKSLSSQFKACQAPLRLYFGVKFYAADPCKLREEITRYLFFLQVKQDILQGRLPVTFDEAAELCAYAVQSELGDFDPRQHTEGYVSEFCFIPNQTEELEWRIAALHRRMGGLVPMMAEYRYLDKVKWLDMYGVDLHPVLGEGDVEYFLGLTPTGIVVYKNKNKVGNYFWPRIIKVIFKGKIFHVRVKDKNNEEHVYAFVLPRKTACKHLWKCCVAHHAFFRLNQTQERSSRENRVLRSVSSNRHSGRSERQAISDNLSRNTSNVNRLPSRRQPRRVNSDSRINARENYESQYDQDTGMVTMMMRPEPVRAPRHRSLPELQGHESPRSTKSAPWETNFDYGLYTHGKESPVSERSNKAREQRSRAMTGSDSESGISQRRKYFPNRRGSDNDSDVSITRRRRRDIDSDSASDVSSRYPASQGNDGSKFPVLYPFHDKENRPNGSIPSLHSAPAGEAKQRRRRRRSKSPSKRPPDELKQHFEYDLKDTDGLSVEELKEIPFVKVETKASLFKLKYSPKLRQKVKAAKQKSLGELDQNRNQLTKKPNSGPVDDETEQEMSVHSQPLPTKGSGNRNTVDYSQSESAYDSDINTHSQRRRDRPQDRTEVTTQADPPRYSSRYWREQDDFGYNGGVRAEAEYERLHPHPVVDSWREGSRSGQRGEGWVKSGYQYREDSSQQSHYAGPPHTSQGAPLYEDRRPGNTSYSSVTSPPQSYHHHHHHHQHLHPPPVSSYASTQSYNYAPSYSSPLSNSHHDQGQRPRSYGQQQDERPRSALHQYEEYRVREEQDRSKSYGSEEGQVTRYQGEGDRSRSSFRDVRPRHPRSPYPEETPQQHYDYQRQTGYQQAAPYQNSTHQYRHPSPQPHNSRTHGTPPRSQGTPPRHQGPPPQYPGTPPRYQGTPSKQSVSSTPPRQNVDPRYSQGRLSVHAREHSEGGSSQASARGAGNFHRSARPSQGAVGSLRSEHRSMGNSLTPEQARQLLKSSSYNPDLCTEL